MSSFLGNDEEMMIEKCAQEWDELLIKKFTDQDLFQFFCRNLRYLHGITTDIGSIFSEFQDLSVKYEIKEDSCISFYGIDNNLVAECDGIYLFIESGQFKMVNFRLNQLRECGERK